MQESDSVRSIRLRAIVHQQLLLKPILLKTVRSSELFASLIRILFARDHQVR